MGAKSARTVENVEMRTVASLGNPIWNPDVAAPAVVGGVISISP